MPENKTIATKGSVKAFIDDIKDKSQREDCKSIIKIMESVSKQKPVMWGSAIVGFGTYHYVYESGREGDISIIGFSPRKNKIALYLHGGVELMKDELPKLGKHETSKGCLYIKSLKDIDVSILTTIIAKSYKSVK